MTHPRRVLRDAVTQALIALNTDAADRVWPAREPPVDVETALIEQGPCILVYTRRDRTAKDGHSGQGYGWEKRECDLYVEITAAGALVVDDKLDAMAEDIEAMMDSIVIPGQAGTEIRHVETNIETTTAFEQPIGGALLEYEACYWREWRKDPDEDDRFPCHVSAVANGTGPEMVADCSACPGLCPGEVEP